MSNIQITDLDFDLIKRNLKTYLQNQEVLKGANYEGSVISTLLNVLALNTHYNAYYLNMAVNEMFLDTASKRNSVVSIAKMLGYTPSSTHSSMAIVNVKITGLTVSEFTIPKYTKFVSDTYGSFYTFVTNDSYTKSVSNGTVLFENVELYEGEIASPESYGVTYQYVYATNPRSSFLIRDKNVDLNTLTVIVQKSSINPYVEYFYPKDNFQNLEPDTRVYFVEETNNEYYQVYFGDGVIGKALEDGNIIYIQYLISSGEASNGASNFSLVSPIETTYTDAVVTTISPSFGGKQKETIESIKYSAPRYYASQGRAVTPSDYNAALMNNTHNFSFDSVNSWGGEENDPPVYGKIFLSMKPSGSYILTDIQKEIIKTKILKPISVATVQPEIVDPDYVFIKVVADVAFSRSKTLYNPAKIQNLVKLAIYNFSYKTLNTFNSTFNYSDLLYSIQQADHSIVGQDCEIFVQKKFTPVASITNYTLNFGTELQQGMYVSNISSSPGLTFRDVNLDSQVYEVFLEEVPMSFNGVFSIQMINVGINYTNPIVNILGDGKNAKAHAVVINGKIQKIVVDDPGIGYTEAVVEIIDGNGSLAKANAIILSKTGNIRAYYRNAKNEKVIFREKVGTVDYASGIVNLTDFNPLSVDNTFGELTISAKPNSKIISSQKNRLLSIDTFVSDSVVVKAVVKA